MNQTVQLAAFGAMALVALVPGGVLAQQPSGKAVADIAPISSSSVTGRIQFQETTGGLRMSGSLKNLSPGRHGLHIHENGSCGGDGASEAGDHFNPQKTPHGGRTDEAMKRHTGDLGNIEADEQGVAQIDLTDGMMQFNGQHSVLNRAVVVHEKTDDLKSQPAGDSGKRIGCGVIRIVRP